MSHLQGYWKSKNAEQRRKGVSIQNRTADTTPKESDSDLVNVVADGCTGATNTLGDSLASCNDVFAVLLPVFELKAGARWTMWISEPSNGD